MQIPNKHIVLATVILSMMLLSSCVTLPASEAAGNQTLTWAQRAEQLDSIHQWTVQGAIGGSIPTKAWSASLRWQQIGHRFNINLFGPLGIGNVQLTGTPGASQLKTAQGKTLQAKNPDTLLYKATGWQLPVSNIYYWVRGLPVPNLPSSKQFDRYHHILKMQQQGWTIEYLRYTSINNIDVPSKIFLQNQQMKIRIVISQWQI